MALRDLQFKGFSSESERLHILRKIGPGKVAILVAAYIQLGNNVERATKSSAKKREDIPRLLQAANTTLARIGVSFMPLTYALRKQGVADGTVGARFGKIKTAIELQDISFQGWMYEEMDDFILAFNSALRPSHEEGSKTKAQPTDWTSVAIVGFQRDKRMASAMKRNITVVEAFDWLVTECKYFTRLSDEEKLEIIAAGSRKSKA
jgi:hypothetical protein